mmetsp:Transcript_15743/g.35000  ORF Transcript_15743/g.35000 Transcript_15743/m.35000 type:complete len:220 (-) Transcript_15743:862-1521(-)
MGASAAAGRPWVVKVDSRALSTALPSWVVGVAAAQLPSAAGRIFSTTAGTPFACETSASAANSSTAGTASGSSSSGVPTASTSFRAASTTLPTVLSFRAPACLLAARDSWVTYSRRNLTETWSLGSMSSAAAAVVPHTVRSGSAPARPAAASIVRPAFAVLVAGWSSLMALKHFSKHGTATSMNHRGSSPTGTPVQAVASAARHVSPNRSRWGVAVRKV